MIRFLVPFCTARILALVDINVPLAFAELPCTHLIHNMASKQPTPARTPPLEAFQHVVRHIYIAMCSKEDIRHCSSISIPMHFHLPRVQSFTGIVEQVRDAMKHLKHEKESEAHQVCRSASILSFPKLNHYAWQIFRQAAGHKPKGVIPQTVNPVSRDLRVNITVSQLNMLG